MRSRTIQPMLWRVVSQLLAGVVPRAPGVNQSFLVGGNVSVRIQRFGGPRNGRPGVRWPTNGRLVLTSATFLASGLGGPVAARSAHGLGVMPAPHRDISRSVERGVRVEARLAARDATS